FEGFVPSDEEANANCKAVSQRRKHGHWHLELINGDATAAPLASPVVESDHSVAEVNEAFRVGPEVAERVQHVCNRLPDTVMPPRHRGPRQLGWRRPLDSRVNAFKQSVEVPPV